MKKLLLLFSLAVMSTGAFAQYSYMTFTTNSGEKFSAQTEGLVITIDNGNLVAADTESTLTLPLNSLASMEFSETQEGTTGIATAVAADSGVKAYTVDGISAGSFSSLAEMRDVLPAGFYVIKLADGNTLKINIKK